jgi:CDP-6-deoxy-D-xylo-4-hexulose-3-dehydrase
MYEWPLMKETINLLDKIGICKFILFNTKYSKGKYVKAFEQQWNKWLGTEYSVFVNSGSSANLILVDCIKELYGLQPGDKVLVPACTWSTNISPIIQAGLTPIFCDINFKNFSFCKDHLKKLAEKHDIKMIFVTHLLGLPSDMDLLKQCFPNALVIEDCCESHGALYHDQKVGTLSLGSTFSFYYGHHMTSVEGGIVSTNNYALYKLLLLKRSHGLARELPKNEYKAHAAQHRDIDSRFLFLTTGYNFRPTEINAFIGLQQLSRLDEYIRIRRDRFNQFANLVMEKDLDKIINLPNSIGNSSFCFPFVFNDKTRYKKFVSLLEENNIETRPIVGSNLTRQPFLASYNFDQTDFPNVNLLHENGIYVGNNQFVDTKMVHALIGLLEDIQ